MTAPRWLGLTNTEFSLGRADCLLPQGSTWLPATFPALQVLMRQKGMGLSWKTSWRRGRSGWQTSTSMPSPALRSPAEGRKAWITGKETEGLIRTGSPRAGVSRLKVTTCWFWFWLVRPLLALSSSPPPMAPEVRAIHPTLNCYNLQYTLAPF